jgi:hypothetical protein
MNMNRSSNAPKFSFSWQSYRFSTPFYTLNQFERGARL